MSVISWQFILFVGIVFILSAFANNKLRKLIILIANVFFILTYGKLIHLIWLLLLIIYSYIMSIIIRRNKNKYILILSIIPLIISLAFFKYCGLFGFTNIIMPLGLSFYTFKIISYLYDLYKKKVKRSGLLDYAIYVSFFPVISAGPINRAKSFMQQLNAPYVFNYRSSKNGAVLCALGMFQKMVFADYLGMVCNNIFASEVKGISLLFGVILYAFYIYMDFDGYSNIAIGISKLLGFEIDRNFKTPYLATSIMEFWNRWHISLSSWLKDYIYIPLGGNRKGTLRKYINIMIVFIISGLWHGSTLVFLIWGIGHGIVNIVENVIKNIFKDVNWPKAISIIGKFCGIIFNFMLVSFLWIFFRSANLNEAINIIQNIFNFNGLTIDIATIGITIKELYWIMIIIIIIIISDIMRNHTNMIEWLANRNFIIRWGFYILLIFITLIFGIYGPGYNASDFIYAIF